MLKNTAAAWSSSVSPRSHWIKWRTADSLKRSSSSAPAAFIQFRLAYLRAPFVRCSAHRSNIGPSNTSVKSVLSVAVSRTIPEANCFRSPESLISKARASGPLGIHGLRVSGLTPGAGPCTDTSGNTGDFPFLVVALVDLPLSVGDARVDGRPRAAPVGDMVEVVAVLDIRKRAIRRVQHVPLVPFELA